MRAATHWLCQSRISCTADVTAAFTLIVSTRARMVQRFQYAPHQKAEMMHIVHTLWMFARHGPPPGVETVGHIPHGLAEVASSVLNCASAWPKPGHQQGHVDFARTCTRARFVASLAPPCVLPPHWLQLVALCLEDNSTGVMNLLPPHMFAAAEVHKYGVALRLRIDYRLQAYILSQRGGPIARSVTNYQLAQAALQTLVPPVTPASACMCCTHQEAARNAVLVRCLQGRCALGK